ncbi:transferrin-like [Vanessa cardui]|uniref:transferrin-like n=1 Tax=Vanessa cardui TaxID=171605 RepID=UPI001F13E55A|nr:transferrin-like [Vanessa cardui]
MSITVIKMKLFCFIFFCVGVRLVQLQGLGSGSDGNLRVCIVEGRGPLKRGATFCPLLDAEDSGLECVLGSDQLDCLRRISKGTVDFGVFSPEDLIAAQWANIDVLVTNELRNRHRPFERSVVAVVSNRILPEHESSLDAVLRNSTLCHPGVGVNTLRPLSDTLSGYLESLIIPRACDPELTLTENRLKAIGEFFNRACKAGPWVPDRDGDLELKRKYRSLCAACASPDCSMEDKYWGPVGALQCLAEGAGDAMWGELDDVLAYFGINSTSKSPPMSPEGFSFLCRDGSYSSLDAPPCTWLQRPWPVVIAKRKAVHDVSKLISSLKEEDLFNNHWRGALTALLEIRQAPTPLNPPRVPLDYLASAKGFREAYSQSGCDPPRHITLCTTTLLEKNKCEWLSEAGAVYGVNPPLQCVLRSDHTACLRAVHARESDVSVASGDAIPTAMRDYNLRPILFEVTPIVEKMDTVLAYVRADAIISKMADLRGKRAAFPRYDGVAWHSVLRYIQNKEKINCYDATFNYFSEICAPGVEKYNTSSEIVDKFTSACYKEDGRVVDGEMAALRALVEGRSDVAFISMKTFNMYQNKLIMEPWASTVVDIISICPEENTKYCYISWSNIGHIFAANNITQMRRHEVITVFTKLDQLFGKHQPFHSVMFTMYGQFNHQLDILFHNNTKILATENILNMHPYRSMPLNFERSFLNNTSDSCQITDLAPSAADKMAPMFLLLMSSLLTYVLSS